MDSSKELLDKKVEVPADGVNKKLPAHDNLEIDILRSDLQSDLQSDLPSDSQRSDRPGVQVPDRESEKAGSMFYEGVAKLDKRTKKLVKRLKP